MKTVSLFLAVFLLCISLTNCVTEKTDVPWDAAIVDLLSESVVQGTWASQLGGSTKVYVFHANRYKQTQYWGEKILLQFEGFFRIRDNNIELLKTGSRRDDGTMHNFNFDRYRAPHDIYSFELKDDVLTLKVVGGTEQKDYLGSVTRLERVVN